jgi:hypothetical protein
MRLVVAGPLSYDELRCNTPLMTSQHLKDRWKMSPDLTDERSLKAAIVFYRMAFTAAQEAMGKVSGRVLQLILLLSRDLVAEHAHCYQAHERVHSVNILPLLMTVFFSISTGC